jgi:hypothetical protein
VFGALVYAPPSIAYSPSVILIEIVLVIPVTVIRLDVTVVLAFASLTDVNENAFGLAPDSNETELLLEVGADVELTDLLDAMLLFAALNVVFELDMLVAVLDIDWVLEDLVSDLLPPPPPPQAEIVAIRLNKKKNFLLQIERIDFFIRGNVLLLMRCYYRKTCTKKPRSAKRRIAAFKASLLNA